MEVMCGRFTKKHVWRGCPRVNHETWLGPLLSRPAAEMIWCRWSGTPLANLAFDHFIILLQRFLLAFKVHIFPVPYVLVFEETQTAWSMLENAVQCVDGNEHVKVTITAMEKDHYKPLSHFITDVVTTSRMSTPSHVEYNYDETSVPEYSHRTKMITKLSEQDLKIHFICTVPYVWSTIKC